MPLLGDLAPMSDPRHVYRLGRVVNLVYDPVIADANPPLAIAALEFFTARRPGSRREAFQTGHDAGDHLGGQPYSSFSALAVKTTR
jgi:hypothetical protein